MSFSKKTELLNRFCNKPSFALAKTNLLTNKNVEQSLILFQSWLSEKLDTLSPVKSSSNWVPKCGRFNDEVGNASDTRKKLSKEFKYSPNEEKRQKFLRQRSLVMIMISSEKRRFF